MSTSNRSDRPVSKVVIAPPGPLGIKVRPANSASGDLVVLNVDLKSPLFGKVNPGDCIVKLDGDDIKGISSLAEKKDEGRLLGVLTMEDQQRLRAQSLKVALGPSVSLLEYTAEPPGAHLGLMLDDQHVVVEVCDGSPLEGKVWVKDKIYTVNGINVGTLDSTQLANYFDTLREQFEMVILKVERDPKPKRNPQVRKIKALKKPPGESENDPWVHDFLSPEQGRAKNRELRVGLKKNNKTNYSALLGYGVPLGFDEASRKTREELLSQLILWNDRHKIEQEFNIWSNKRGTGEESDDNPRARLYWVPMGCGPTLTPEMPIADVVQYCKKSRMFDEAVEGIAMHFGKPDFEAGLDLVLQYFAHTRPQHFEKFHKVAQQALWEEENMKKREEATKERKKKKNSPRKCSGDESDEDQQQEDVEVDRKSRKAEDDEPIELPPDYRDWDESGDYKWNVRYMDLIKYRQEHGHCMVSTRDIPLGKWVAWQRESNRKQYASLTDKRRELLDNLGFVWEAKHNNRKPFVETGDPRLNKALALKFVFADGSKYLSDLHALTVAGYTQHEMEEVRNPTHPWRNGLVVLKKRLDARMKTMEAYLEASRKADGQNVPRRKTFSAVQELIDTLQDESLGDERYVQVLGPAGAKQLQTYLTQPEDAADGSLAKKKRTYAKRRREDLTNTIDDHVFHSLEDHITHPSDGGEPTLELVTAATAFDNDAHPPGGGPHMVAAWGADVAIEGTPGPDQHSQALQSPNSHQLQHDQEDLQQESLDEQSPWRKGYVLPTAAYGGPFSV